jgi:predicted kinase
VGIIITVFADERPRPELVVLMGLQASGKSTFFRDRFAATHVHVSKDEMKNVRHREGRQRELVLAALTAGRSVVVDNTNATRADRAALIALARGCRARVVGYHLLSRRADSLARNRAREGRARVPDVAIFATAKRWEPPLLAEGFDALWEVRIAGDMQFEVAPVEAGPSGGAPSAEVS